VTVKRKKTALTKAGTGYDTVLGRGTKLAGRVPNLAQLTTSATSGRAPSAGVARRRR